MWTDSTLKMEAANVSEISVTNQPINTSSCPFSPPDSFLSFFNFTAVEIRPWLPCKTLIWISNAEITQSQILEEEEDDEEEGEEEKEK
jgi:hypothetical protein